MMKGYDGSRYTPSAQILGQVDGTPVSGSFCPGKIVFRTSGDATGKQDRMTIRSNGSIGIGTSNPAYKLDVEGHAQAYGFHTGDIFFQKDGK